MSQLPKPKAKSFADLIQRATGYNSEPLAANLITQYMPTQEKVLAVEAYNQHIETHNSHQRLHELADAACVLMGRPDLHHEVYELLLKPPERI